MISKDDVRYVAHLSRIHLQDQEVERLSKDLENILHYVEKLQKVDINNIKQTTHVLPLKNVFREDVVRTSLKQGEVKGLTQNWQSDSFKVPQVIE